MTFELMKNLLPPAPREKLNIDIEYLFSDSKIGFGGWQTFITLILFIPSFIGGLIVLNTAFTVATPGHFQCRIKDCKSQENAIDVDTALHAGAEREAPYVDEFPNFCVADDCSGNPKAVECDTSDKFDFFNFSEFNMNSSILTDNNALCMKPYGTYIHFANSCLFVGFLIGGSLFGMISDRFGRRNAIGLSVFTAFIGTGLGGVFRVPEFYAVTRIIAGAGGIGCFLMAFTLIVEILGKKSSIKFFPWHVTWFTFFGNIIAVPYALGEAANAFIAHLQPDWDIFQFIVSFVCGFGIIVYFLIPESPRWLIETGKRRRVEDLLIHAALVNGYEIQIPEDFGIEKLDEYLSAEMSDIDNVRNFVSGLRAETTFAYGRNGLFHPDVMCCSLILFFLWTLISFIYYGTSIGAEELRFFGDTRMVVAIVALVEIPGFFFSGLTMDSFGRKPVMIGMLFLSAMFKLAAAVIMFYDPTSEASIAACILASKTCIASTYTIIRIYTTEIYPTNLRATGLGTCKSISAFFTILAPWFFGYFPTYNRSFKAWVYCINGVLCMLAGFICFQLPDTVGFSLPETFECLKRMKEKQKNFLQVVDAGWNPLKKKKNENSC